MAAGKAMLSTWPQGDFDLESDMPVKRAKELRRRRVRHKKIAKLRQRYHAAKSRTGAQVATDRTPSAPVP
jgi:hypothetical protein